MRIVWKDSQYQIPKNPKRYRKHAIIPYNNDDLIGWTLDFEDDHNVYASRYSAMNAIDARLGGYGNRGVPSKKRMRSGIKIVGRY